MASQACYKRDSNCTQFCGKVDDSGWRHECFSRCDSYLGNCLDTGVWTDKIKGVLTLDGGGPKNPRASAGKFPKQDVTPD